MKTCLILLVCLIGFAPAVDPAEMKQEDFEISGVVENVSYNAVSQMPCEVAMGKDNARTGKREYFAYQSRSLAMCQFAERSKVQRLNIKLYGKTIQTTNFIFRMEYGNTKSKLKFKMPKLRLEKGETQDEGERQREDKDTIPKPLHSMYS